MLIFSSLFPLDHGIKLQRKQGVTFAAKTKIICINVNGFRSREAELRNYVAMQGSENIYAFSDTRLTRNINVKNFQGYTIIRKDRDYTGRIATAGGVLLLIPQKWTCKKIENIQSGPNCESLCVIIIPPKQIIPFKLAVVYNHPNQYFPQNFLMNIRNTLFNGRRLPAMVVGDYNCPHKAFNSRTSNEFGSKLLQNINNENFLLLNDERPTYYSSATGLSNLLDSVLVDTEMNRIIESCETKGDVGSDHIPVITYLKSTAEEQKRTIVNMKLWANMIDKRMESVVITDNIDTSINEITELFRETKDKCTKIIDPRKRKLPTEIRENIIHRQTLLKLKRKATSEFVRIALTKEYNRVNHLVKRQLREHDERQVEQLANEVAKAENLTKMWKLFNKHKKNETCAVEPDSPLICPDGNFTTNNIEKSREFARHMKSVHQTADDPIFDTQFKTDTDKMILELDKRRAENESLDKLQPTQFRELLSSTKKKSSPGEDLISYDILKSCNDKSIGKLCRRKIL